MTTCSLEILTSAEAVARRSELMKEIGDVERFKERGETFQLDADDRVKYNELLNLEFLLGL